MDKDTLIKNRFWIVLGVAVALALVDWLLVLFVVPGKVGDNQKKVENSWKSASSYKEFTHPSQVKAARDRAAALQNESAKVHETLYDNQAKEASLMTWPKTLAQYDFNSGKNAVDVAIKPTSATLASLPKDDATHYAGTLVDAQEDFLKVKGQDNKTVEFFKTSEVKIMDEESKVAKEWGELAIAQDQNRLVVVTYSTGKSFGAEFTMPERLAFASKYKDQLPEVIAELGPVNALGQPLVLLRYGGSTAGPRFGAFQPKGAGAAENAEFANDAWIYRPGAIPPPDNHFLSYVANWGDENSKDYSAEIWAAQEDLWITRDLYRRLKAANDTVAHFEHVSTDSQKWEKFKNSYWEIDLKVDAAGVLAKLKNIRPTRQNIDGLHFLVRFTGKDAPPLVFPPKDNAFRGNALGKDEIYTTSAPMEVPGAVLRGVFSVDQILTVETAAVKRVDLISIGDRSRSLSQREAYRPLIPFPYKKAKVAGGKDDPAAAGGKEEQKFQKKAGANAIANADAAANQYMNLNRYLEVSQSRKVPICLVLIVDPEQLALVQAELDSSPLRFLTTQVLWARSQISLPRAESTSAPPRPSATQTPKLGKKMARGIGLEPAVNRAAPSSSAEDSQENLELTIYGVITIYARPTALGAAKE